MVRDVASASSSTPALVEALSRLSRDVAVVRVDGDGILYPGSEERRGVQPAPAVRVMSTDAVCPRSAFKGTHDLEPRQPGGLGFFRQGRRGEEALRRRGIRLVHPSFRKSAAMRGLKNVPLSSLWKSTRALAESESQEPVDVVL